MELMKVEGAQRAILANAALTNGVLKGMAVTVLIGFACALSLGYGLRTPLPVLSAAQSSDIGCGGARNLPHGSRSTAVTKSAKWGKALDTTLEKVGDAMRSIAESSLALSSSSEELSAVSHQMSANAEETSTQANVVSAAAEQVTRNLQTGGHRRPRR